MIKKITTVLLILFMVAASVLPMNPKKIYAQTLPIENTTEETEVEDSFLDYPTTTDSDFDITSIELDYEDKSKRTEDSKTFRRIDGTYVVAMYNTVVHYEEDGKLLDIDNTLDYDETNNEYDNKANKFKIKLPKTIDDNKSFKLTLDDYKIDWSIYDINSAEIEYDVNDQTPKSLKELTNINQSVIYKNIQSNVDLEYIITGNKIKENIVLNEYIEDYSLTFNYDIKNLNLELNSKGDYVFTNDLGVEIFSFEDLYMIDANEEISYDIDFIVTEIKKGEYEIEIIPSDDFLSTATYPVTIDPTIDSRTQTINFEDTYVSQGVPSGIYSASTFLRVSNSVSTSQYEALFRFDLPSYVMDQEIVFSKIVFTKSSQTANRTIALYKNDTTFTASSTSWSNRPTTSSTMTDYHVVDSNTLYSFDITKTVREWQATGSTTTTGFTLRDKDYYGAYNSVRSSNDTVTNRPIIEIGYIDGHGLKDYWTYNSQNVGRVGTGYISDYTGELSFIRNDISFNNDIQGMGVSFAFNNIDNAINKGYGDGWNINYNTFLDWDDDLDRFFTKDFTGNITYYYSKTCESEYEGTFPDVNTCFISEDGSNKTLVEHKDGTILENYFIYDDQEKKTFNTSGYLTKIENIDYNVSLVISRDTVNPDKILYIRDESSNYLRFNYNGNLIDSILLRSDEIETDATYDSNDYLEKVIYEYDSTNTTELEKVRYRSDYDLNGDSDNDETVYYDYNTNGNLYKGYVLFGEEIIYSYDTSLVNKVIEVESLYNNIKVSEITYDYNYKETIIKDHENNFVIYKFDNYGHTVNIVDKNANTTYYEYYDLFGGYLGGAVNYKLNHMLINQSTPQNQTFNPVVDYSFEQDDNSWSYIENGYGDIVNTMSVIGNKSYEISPSVFGGGYAFQALTLKEGSYTLRASVYVNGNTEDDLYIEIQGNKAYYDNQTYGSWKYIELPFVLTGTTTIYIKLCNYSNYDAYFDNISIIDGLGDSRVNIIENPSFEQSGVNNWTVSHQSETSVYLVNQGTSGIDETYTNILGDYAVGIVGDSLENRKVSATISKSTFVDNPLNNGKFLVGGWANTYTAPGYFNADPDENDKKFRINVEFLNGSTPIYTEALDFNQSLNGWQYIYNEISVPTTTYTDIRISFEYQGEGEVIFDGISAFYLEDNIDYTFDDNRRLTEIDYNDGREYTYDYDDTNGTAENPYRITDENGIETLLESDDYVIESVERNNVKSVPTYNTLGQMTKMEVKGEDSNGVEQVYFSSNTYYTSDNQYINRTQNEYYQSTYYYHSTLTGLLENVTNSENVETNYEYYDNGQLMKVYIGDEQSDYPYAKYIYDSKDRLKEIELDNNYSYKIYYNDLGQMEYVTVNNDALMSYSYNSGLIDSFIFNNYNIYESTGAIYGVSTSTVTRDGLNTTIQTNANNLDPSFGGVIEVEPNTVYTVSADISSITGTVKFNIFEYSDTPSTSTYIGVRKSSTISISGELSYQFTTSSNASHIIVSFYDSSTYTVEFSDLNMIEAGVIYDKSISSQIYGNNDRISFIYNEENKVEEIQFQGSGETLETRFKYFYDSQGRLSIYEDEVLNITEYYEYNESGNIDKIRYSNGDSIIYGYDYMGNINRIDFNINLDDDEPSNWITYDHLSIDGYDFYDETIYNFGGSDIKKDYFYQSDELRSLEQIKFYRGSNNLFLDLDYSYLSQKTRVYEISYNFYGTGVTDVSYTYTYDSIGNITEVDIDENNVLVIKKEYDYDDYNQLIEEHYRDYSESETTYTEENCSKYYYYDNNGNITLINSVPWKTQDDFSEPYTARQVNYGVMDAKMYYNGFNTYTTMYELDVNESPSLSFTFKDMDFGTTIYNMNVYQISSNLDTSTTGYYYTNYGAYTSNFQYELEFRILYKVGNPLTGPEASVTYTYDTTWLDQLDSYSVLKDNVTKTSTMLYDDQGNPYNITNFIYNGTKYNQADLEWDGRQLSELIVYNDSQKLDIEVEISYTYNDQGIRTQKIIEDDSAKTKYEYKLNGDILITEICSIYDSLVDEYEESYRLDYAYDYDGSAIGVTLKKGSTVTDYIYVKNIQGDITYITNTIGIVITEYKYDAYGNILNLDDLSANTIDVYNSLRYRSYKYDSETSLYYLNSRYYNPEVGRFINADGILGEIGKVQSANMYAYCNNNSVTYISNSFSKHEKININNSTDRNNNNSNFVSVYTKEQVFGKGSRHVYSTSRTYYLIKSDIVTIAACNLKFKVKILSTSTPNGFYSFEDIGNKYASAGVGLNLGNWYKLYFYSTTSIGFGWGGQITPWITSGTEISLMEGLSISIGATIDNINYSLSFNVGTGIIAAYALAKIIAFIPLPAARLISTTIVLVATVIVIVDNINRQQQ